MEIKIVMLIICGMIFYLFATFDILMKQNFNISVLNPVRNYKEWCYTLNVFGIGIMTILLNIIFLPYAIIYWLAKLIYFILTVGRKEKIMVESKKIS